MYKKIQRDLEKSPGKIQTIKGLDGNDLRYSHDFEDLIYVLNNRRDIADLFEHEEDRQLKEYIAVWSNDLLARPYHLEEIECMLPYYFLIVASRFKLSMMRRKC